MNVSGNKPKHALQNSISHEIRKEKAGSVLLQVKHKGVDRRSSKHSGSTSTTKKFSFFKISTAQKLVSPVSLTKFVLEQNQQREHKFF